MEGQSAAPFHCMFKRVWVSVKACTIVNIDNVSAHVLKLPRILGRRFADAYDLRVSLVS